MDHNTQLYRDPGTDSAGPELLGGRAPMSSPKAQASEATRLLCAAAHADPSFVELTLREVLFQPHRAVAPSYGVDLVPIVRHCLAARRRMFWRDVALTSIVVIALLIAPIDAVLAVVVLLGLGEFIEAGKSLTRTQVPAAIGHLLLGSIALMAVFGWVLSQPVQRQLRTTVAGAPSLRILPFVILAAWLVLFLQRMQAHRMLAHRLTPEQFSPGDAPPETATFRGRLEYISKAQRGNVTVYSPTATRRPFLGSGPVIESWSIASPLVSASKEDAEQGVPLNAGVVYESIRKALAGLADPAMPAHEKIGGLSLQDRLFVGGLLSRDHPFVSRAKRQPLFRVSPDVVSELSRAPRGQERHYLTVRVMSWDGEVEVTCFVFVGVRGRMLFVEFVATALTGIHPAYRAIDGRARINTASVFGTAVRSLGEVFPATPRAPLHLVQTAGKAIGRWYGEWRDSLSIGHRLAFDYGARQSVREMASAVLDGDFFQRLDSEQHVRIVARRLIAAITSTLTEHGYDTADFDHRASTAIDNSINITGSTVNDVAFATGKGSRAKAAGGGKPNTKLPRSEG